VRLYAFTSKTLTNIWAGVGAQLWAVPNSGSEQSNKGRATKASKMAVGSLGILYCTENRSFTSPFIVLSHADPIKVVANVWEGERGWILPFRIRTIGNPHSLLPWELAKAELSSCQAGVPRNTLIHVEPLTVFTCNEISGEDWSYLVRKLAN
jgi:hypothetical protein